MTAPQLESDFYKVSVKSCSHGAIATAIYFSQLIDSMGFSFVVLIVPHEHLDWIPAVIHTEHLHSICR